MTLDQVDIVGREIVIMKKFLDQATPEVYATLMNMLAAGLVRDLVKKFRPDLTVVEHKSDKTHRPDCQIEEEHVHWEYHYSLMPSSLLQRVADRARKAVNDAEDKRLRAVGERLEAVGGRTFCSAHQQWNCREDH